MPANEAEARASAAPGVGGRRNLPGTDGGAEAGTTAGGETKPEALRLMEAVVERSNMLRTYERVVKNQGAPGVDGLTTSELKPWLQAHWGTIREALLAGRAWQSATNGRGPWWNGGASHMHHAYPKAWFDRMGLVSLLDIQRRFLCVS